jgi:uncharacterized membrane protein
MKMEPLTWIGLTALVVKITSVIKRASVGDVQAVLTQTVVWVVAVLAMFLVAQADIAGGLTIGEAALSAYDWQSLIVVGLALGSGGSFAYDVKRAIDNTDTATEPHLGEDY